MFSSLRVKGILSQTVHATYPDNYTYAAVHDQLQTFRRKEKKLKGSLAILKSFRLLTGQRKTGTKWHPRSNPVITTHLQKHKATGNTCNNSKCMRYANFMTSKCKTQ